VTIVVWVLVGAFAVWAAVRLGGLEHGWIPVCAMAFTPYAAALSPVPLVLAALTGTWWAVAVAGGTVAVFAGTVLPRALGRAQTDPAGRQRGQHAPAGGQAGPGSTGARLRLLSANVYQGEADLDALLWLIRELRVEVLAVQELTPAAARKLAAAGISDVLPEQSLAARPEGRGAGLYSALPLVPGQPRVNPGGFHGATARLRIPGAAEVLVESVHPPAPSTPGAVRDWRDGQAGQARATPDGPLRVLAGDFNATLDHAPLRRLLRSGYRDAAQVVGQGLRPTWHHDQVRLPGAVLDHVLADRRIRIAGVEVHPLPGSDHAVVFAELILPG
jgi:endonuclease/exonuclease/phosphatase family metal-dependent hydrolase